MSVSSVRTEYSEWIADYVAKHPYGRGLCLIACQEMRAVFPELKEVRGWANGTEHAWLVDPVDHIVDPTAHQFRRVWDSESEAFKLDETISIEYRAFQPGDSVRVGRCMECGDAIFAEVERLDDPKYARSLCDDCRGGDQAFGRSPYEEP